MKKIVLTSCGFSSDNLKIEFANLFYKPINECRVLYIPIASNVEVDKTWIEIEMNHLYNMGVNKSKITEYRFEHEVDIKKFDFIYVLGGNSYYLLKQFRDNNFKSKIIEALNNGIVYVGSSAGSMVLGKNIEANFLFEDEENNYLSDLTGLELFNGIVIPHYQRIKSEKSKEYINKTETKIYALDDGHAIFILDDVIIEK